MSGIAVNQKIRHATIEATIIRADGRIEKLGCIAYYDKNPLKRWAWRIGRLFKRITKW